MTPTQRKVQRTSSDPEDINFNPLTLAQIKKTEDNTPTLELYKKYCKMLIPKKTTVLP